MKMPTKMKINVDASVKSLSRMRKIDAERVITGTRNREAVKFLFPPEHVSTFRVVLDYPLNTEVGFSIVADSFMSIGSILHAIAMKYKAIYRKQTKYGVWGHGIEDLYIESLKLNMKKGTIKVDIGS